jgi:AraC family transcriptional regulator of arabinose operon
MLSNLQKRWGVGELAKIAGMSASRFAHLFRRQVGVPPQQFVEQRRLMRAEQLLKHSSLSVKEISHDVGFRSPFYFSLRFKSRTGKSPRAYRAVAQK